MGKKKNEIFDPYHGYNLLAGTYHTYHKHLDGFSQDNIKKFLPHQNLDTTLDIIDLGSGDGRLYKYLSTLSYRTYVAFDIADQLLAQHPGKNIKKIVGDLEEILPFDDHTFDLATSFFVLEHIDDVSSLFDEVYRILKPGGRRIIGHFLQRREFIHTLKEHRFKIASKNRRLTDLEYYAKRSFFDLFVYPIQDHEMLLGYFLIAEKH